MAASWLQSYISDALARNVCARPYCTTCGAREFRRGVLTALAAATGRPAAESYDRESALEIASALAEVGPSDHERFEMNEAVRTLLIDLCTGIPLFDQEVVSRLEGSWAGRVHAEMVGASLHAAEQRRARAEYDDPVNVQRRRDEKKREKQERHLQRLEAKKERDRIWWEKHGGRG